jgi:hypothetical protein
MPLVFEMDLPDDVSNDAKADKPDCASAIKSKG